MPLNSKVVTDYSTIYWLPFSYLLTNYTCPIYRRFPTFHLLFFFIANRLFDYMSFHRGRRRRGRGTINTLERIDLCVRVLSSWLLSYRSSLSNLSSGKRPVIAVLRIIPWTVPTTGETVTPTTREPSTSPASHVCLAG